MVSTIFPVDKFIYSKFPLLFNFKKVDVIEDEDQAHSDAQAHVEDAGSDQILITQGDHDSISAWAWYYNCRYVFGFDIPPWKYRGVGALEGASYKYQRDYYTDIHLSLKDKSIDIANTGCGLKLRIRVMGLYDTAMIAEGGEFGVSGNTISVAADDPEKAKYLELEDATYLDGEYTWRITNQSGWPTQPPIQTPHGTGWIMKVVVSSSLTHHFAIADINWCLIADSVWALDESNAIIL